MWTNIQQTSMEEKQTIYNKNKKTNRIQNIYLYSKNNRDSNDILMLMLSNVGTASYSINFTKVKLHCCIVTENK